MFGKARHKEKPAWKFSKGVVLLCIFMTTAYTLNVLGMCWQFETLPPSELTVGVFAMYSIEFGSMAAIKRKEYALKADTEEDHEKQADK